MLITNGLPEDQFVNVVREDPKRPGLLYAGTDWGVYYSLDDGGHWQSLQMNLPPASVRDIAFGGNDVVVGTHGRAIWVLDDPAPIRQSEGSIMPTALFRPSPAMLFQRAGTFGFGAFDEGTPLPPEEPQGENAPWGAVIDYALGKDFSSVRFTIVDAQGKLVRNLSSTDKISVIDPNQLEIPAYWVKPQASISSKRGTHRLIWNLRYRSDDGPLVPPGDYRLSMTIDGQMYSTRLAVIKDPRVSATVADLKAQFELSLRIGDEIKLATSLRDRIQSKLKSKVSASEKSRLLRILGAGGTGTPDQGGTAPMDFGSLRRIIDALEGVKGAVQSAPSAPLSLYQNAFADLKQRVEKLRVSVG